MRRPLQAGWERQRKGRGSSEKEGVSPRDGTFRGAEP